MSLRVGVVGAGAMGASHVQAWRELGVPVVLHSHRPPTELAERFGARLAPSLTELVGDSGLVDVCTPTPSHPELVHTAIAAGRHVVCEKPLARTAALAAELAAAADAAGVLLFPAHVVRYFPAYERLHEALSSGREGQPRSARFTRQVAGPAAGSWFHDTTRSGGVAFDLMIHDLDQALWHFGPVERVTARPLEASGPAVQATLRHSGGVETTVEATWGPPDAQFVTTYAVQGDSGSLAWDSRHEPAGHESPYTTQLRDVLGALDGATPRVTAQEGVAAVALAERVLAALADR